MGLPVAVRLLTAPSIFAGHAVDGFDVKGVTDDNNNVDGGLAAVTPSEDVQNQQSNEPTVAISPAASPVTGNVGDFIAPRPTISVPRWLSICNCTELSERGFGRARKNL